VVSEPSLTIAQYCCTSPSSGAHARRDPRYTAPVPWRTATTVQYSTVQYITVQDRTVAVGTVVQCSASQYSADFLRAYVEAA